MPKPALPLLLSLCALCIHICTNAQTATLVLEKIASFTLQPQPIAFPQKLPLSFIRVVDDRQDTSKVGYATRRKYYEKVLLAGGVQASVQRMLNSTAGLDSSAPLSLLIVVRRLWLNEPTVSETSRHSTNRPTKGFIHFYSECAAKLEVYAQQGDAFIPLFRIDSTFRMDKSIHKDGAMMLNAPFGYCLEKLARIDFGKVYLSKQRLSGQQVQQHNSKLLTFLILTGEKKQRGLYLSYADFLNNKTTPLEFEVEFGKLTDQLYVLDKGSKRLYTDLWGYCDGEKLFIKMGFNYCELVRQGNTFEFLGNASMLPQSAGTNYSPVGGSPSELVTNLATLATLDGVARVSSINNGLKPFQLDMETGTSY